MTTAKELLAMIEAVKPDDAIALNKLEYEVFCFLHPRFKEGSPIL